MCKNTDDNLFMLICSSGRKHRPQVASIVSPKCEQRRWIYHRRGETVECSRGGPVSEDYTLSLSFSLSLCLSVCLIISQLRCSASRIIFIISIIIISCCAHEHRHEHRRSSSRIPEEICLWLKLIRKVREGVMSPMTLQRQRSLTPCITDREPMPDSSSDKEPGSPKVSEGTPPPPQVTERGGSLRDRRQNQGGSPRGPLRSVSMAPPHRVSDCLRHGNSSDARAVRAVCLLMGGAAASSALGYLNSCSPSSSLATRAPEIPHTNGGLSDLSSAGSFHACSQDTDSPQFSSFDFEGDSDFDAFDCGGFAF
ncbi:uncharacterized protein ACB058_010016 isoform 1-T1 [Synchiropus picturatus]